MQSFYLFLNNDAAADNPIAIIYNGRLPRRSRPHLVLHPNQNVSGLTFHICEGAFNEGGAVASSNVIGFGQIRFAIYPVQAGQC